MRISEIFAREKIEYFGALDISMNDIRRTDVIERRGFDASLFRTAIVFLIPYYVNDGVPGNVSLYARSRDYHAYCDGLFGTLEKEFKAEYGGTFLGFADKSPIEETGAAQKAGLCVRGDSYVVINEKYGSYVFIGEIITDIPASVLGLDGTPKEARGCLHCGKCRMACPMVQTGNDCLSRLTQKKGELTPDEEEYIKKYGYVWGCDICQNVCPLNEGVSETPIDFFRKDRIAYLDGATLDGIDDEEFQTRAFSWRGRKTVERNVKLFEKK